MSERRSNNRVEDSLKGIESNFEGLGRPVIISAGISLSNSPHVGHMREFYTAYGVSRYLDRAGVANQIVAVADDLDPLKKRYPDMPEEYAEFVGRPLLHIPDHTEQFSSRVERNLSEFTRALDGMELDMTIVRSSELYRSAEMKELKQLAILRAGEVAAILAAITGSQKERSKGIINVCCPHCSKISVDYQIHESSTYVNIACGGCKEDSMVDLLGDQNKFRWRVDWPARWVALGVDVEPVAEDHTTKGGSYETAVAVSSAVFAQEPPVPIKYRWARYNSGEVIHGSERPMTAYEVSERVAPIALKAFFSSTKLSHELVIDPKNLLYDSLAAVPEFEGTLPSPAVLRELYYIAEKYDIKPSLVATTAYLVEDQILLDALDKSSLIDSENIKKETTVSVLDEDATNALFILEQLVEIEWAGDDSIENAIRSMIDPALNKRKVFQAMYNLLLQQTHGPKLSRLVRLIGKDKLQEVVESSDLIRV